MYLFATGMQVCPAKVTFLPNRAFRARRTITRNTSPPSHGSVVVMCSGVRDDIPLVIVRKIDGLRVATKSELQYPHPGEAQIIAQLLDIRSDHTKVFGNDRQLAERAFYGPEEFSPRRLHPTPALGSLIAAGDFPTRRKPAKVVDAHEVHCLQRRAYAFHPPAEAIRPH